jgi:hypothetical protein
MFENSVCDSRATIVERLIAAGNSPTAVSEAIALIRTGRADLLDQVIAGELGVARALRIAKLRGRP